MACLIVIACMGPFAVKRNSPLESWLQHGTLRDFADGDHAPERGQQLAGEGDDHRRLACAPGALGPASVPLCQRAVLPKQKEAPGELDRPRRSAAQFRLEVADA